MINDLEHKIEDIELNSESQGVITEIINSAFKEKGKVLVDDYFSIVSNYNPDAYLFDEKKGTAITYELDDFTYLCKAAVSPNYQKQGVGSILMDYLIEKNDKFAWRACLKNPCAIKKYKQVADKHGGFYKQAGDYVIFGIGFDKEEEIGVISSISSVPATMEVIK